MEHNAEDTMSDCVRLSASYEKIATSFLGSLGTFTTQTMDNTEHYGWHGCEKKAQQKMRFLLKRTNISPHIEDAV